MRILTLLFALFVASPALADSWSSGQLFPGGTTTLTFSSSDGLRDSTTSVNLRNCNPMSLFFDSNGGAYELYSVPTSSSATSAGQMISMGNTDQSRAPVTSSTDWVRAKFTATPSTPAKVTLYCEVSSVTAAAAKPCDGFTASQCKVLFDGDGDGDIADDFQRIAVELAYPDLDITTEQQTVSVDAEFLGATFSAAGQRTSDPLNQGTVQQAAGICQSGGLTLNLNTDGTVTGDVGAAPVAVTNYDMNCPDGSTNCTSGTNGVNYLKAPIQDLSSVVFRKGAQTATCDAGGTCTGDVAFGNVLKDGSVLVVWNAATGDMEADYDRQATNTIDWVSGDIDAQFSSAPGADAACTYQADQGTGITDEPEIAIGLASSLQGTELPWKERVNWCDPHTYTRPDGSGRIQCATGTQNQDTLPLLIRDASWGGATLACDLTGKLVAGEGAACLQIGNSYARNAVTAGAQGKFETRGARAIWKPIVGSTPGTDYLYLLWLDGINGGAQQSWGFDFSLVNSNDAIAAVIANAQDMDFDATMDGYLGSGTTPRIVVDGESTGKLVVRGFSATRGEALNLLESGATLSQYVDNSKQVATGNNGCKYGSSTTDGAGCSGLVVTGRWNSITAWIPGKGTPQTGPHSFLDLIASTAEVRSSATADEPNTVADGLIQINCLACDTVRSHSSSGLAAGTDLSSSRLIVSGVVDFLQADGYASTTQQIVPSGVPFALGDWQGSWTRDDPISTEPNNSGFIAPGLVERPGDPVLEFGAPTGTAAQASTQCLSVDGSAPGSCARPAPLRGALTTERLFIGKVVVTAREGVPTTATACDLSVKVDGACTGCGGPGEPAGGRVFTYGAADADGLGRPLISAGDSLEFPLNEFLTAGQEIQVEVGPPAAQNCQAGTGCSCDGLNALEFDVHTILTDRRTPAP